MIFQPTRPARQHQADALAKAAGKVAFFYLMEMGTGKSYVAVNEFLALHQTGKIDHVLIVANKGSHAEWKYKHLPENVPSSIQYYSHLWTGGTTQTEKNELHILMHGDVAALRILIMNCEAFGSSKTAATVAQNFVTDRTIIVCDESTSIKNTSALRTKFMVRLGQSAGYRRAMTGLATPKNPLDLWGQMSFLGLEHVLGSNWYAFRARYCTMQKAVVQKKGEKLGNTKNVAKITGYRDLDRLRAYMEPYSFRVLKADCLDLPPKIHERALVELTPIQKKAYRDMAKIAMYEIESGVFASVVLAINRLAKLHHILCGFITDEAGNYHDIPTNRLDAMCDVVDEIEGKTTVWCAYVPNVLAVKDKLKERYPDRKCVTYYGKTSTKERAEAVTQFQHGDADFFVGTSATGGMGITLTSCSNAIYYSNSFDLQHRLQSEDRFHRDGQTNAVTYVDLISPGTVDEHILKTLIAKKNVSDIVMDGGIKEWLTFS